MNIAHIFFTEDGASLVVVIISDVISVIMHNKVVRSKHAITSCVMANTWSRDMRFMRGGHF